MQIIVKEDSQALNDAAADRIVEAAQEAIAARGRFTLALAGGSTPQKTYTLLAKSPRREAIDWTKIFLFMSDERCVPFDDERSNFGAAHKNFVTHVPIPETNVLPIPTAAGTPDQIAARYTDTLAYFFEVSSSGVPPVFDLVLLGLGDDGHCASLFPGHPTLEEKAAWVVSSPPGTLPPPVDRVTFTFPLINAARQVMFIVGGKAKADAVQDVLEGSPAVTKRPSIGVQPSSGDLIWMLDAEAAQKLTRTA